MMKKVIVSLLFSVVNGYPSLMDCGTEIAVGSTIMSSVATGDTSRRVIFERDGEELTCGQSKYEPGETLTARINDASSVRYIMEISGGNFDSSCDGLSCDGTRCAKGDGSSFPDGSGEILTAPSDGSDLVLIGGFASGFGTVSIMESCTLLAEEDPDDDDPQVIVVDLAASMNELSTLVDAVASENLVDVLAPPATVTVFAPDNNAFSVAGDIDNLGDTLRYHIVSGSYGAESFTDGMEFTALSGDIISISVADDTVSFNNGQASLLVADLQASNGYIHIINAVLTPPDPPITVRGFMIDLYCWQLNPDTRVAIDGADLDENPEDHTIHCMRDVTVCRENGFGIVVEQDDGMYDLLYAFDEAGNTAALVWLDSTTANDRIGVEVTVTGIATGNNVVLNDLSVPELSDVVIRFHRDVIAHTGFLIDILCWEREGHQAIDGAFLDSNPQDHSIKCMRDVPICREMGHGILKPVSDGCGYDLVYTFDEAGSALALEFIDSTEKENNIIVTVTGEIDTAGTMYVETLEAEDYQIHEGYLVDYYCWTLDPDTRLAFDGADLVNSPQDHSIKCMRDVPECRANGYGLLQMNEDGTGYEYAVDFDDSGDEAALDFVDSATITDDVYVRIQGTPVSDVESDYFTLSSVSIELIPEECRPSRPSKSVEVRGFLIDLYCWQLNPDTRIAIDGADLDESPEDHTIHCMRDIEQCRANGFGVVVEQDDGTYDLVYGFDDAGNEAVLTWLDSTSADDAIGVEITVTGLETGNDVVLNDLTVAELTGVVVRFHRDVITHTGFLIDILCWERDDHVAIDGAILDTNPEEHSIKCMRDVPECRENGHGILKPVSDGCGYDLVYTFDEAGSALALEFIDSTEKENNIIVTVTGEIDTAGTMYVETLEAEDYQIHEGYLVDYYCWTLDPDTRLAFDGADLVNSPQDHSIKCMRDVPECRANGYGLLQMNEDGTGYEYAVDFDDSGDEAALDFVDSATITDDVYVRIQGTPVSDVESDYFTLSSVSIELIPEECRPSRPSKSVEVRGFLIDLYCWQLNPDTRIAIDGADLDESPEDHTIHCMRDIEQCRANGFGVVVEQDDGTYDLVYGFDDAGNEAVLAWLDSTSADDAIGVEITVTGLETGNDVVLNDLTVAELTGVVVRFHRDVITHTGFLIDILCWERDDHVAIDGAILDTNPEEHSIKCMRDVPECRENGHGILRPVSDGCGYDLVYTFDEAGSALALEFIDSTEKENNIIVTVTGEIDTAGTMYVETLEAEDYQIHEGYLVDYYCWTLDPDTRLAFDGADLVNSPQDHSIKCMRDVPECRANGYGLLQMNEDGTGYEYAVDFDDSGDEAALDFVDSATITDDVYVRIQGTPVSNVENDYFTLSSVSIELIPEECRNNSNIPQTPEPTLLPEVNCDSDDPDYDFALALDGSLTFYWRIVGDSLQGRLLKKGGGFAAIAASNDEFMPNSDAIIGLESEEPSKYEILTRTTPSKRGESEQTLTDTSTTVLDNGDVDYRFTKILVEDGEIPLNAVGETLFIWAHGSGGLAFHGNQLGALTLDLGSCNFETISLKPVTSQAIKIHGMLMIAAWSFCAPLGILFARLKHLALRHGFLKTWLYAHAFMQITMLVLTAIGFSIAYKAIKKSDLRDDHLTFRHPKLGVTTMVGAMANVLMGILRPHPSPAGEDKSFPRLCFECLHRVVGFGTAIVSLITQLAGIYKAMDLQHISQIRTWNAAVLVPVCTTGFLGIIATLYINFWMDQPSNASPHKGVDKAVELAEEGETKKTRNKFLLDILR